MSLFERDDVRPPEPCSRCGVEVAVTSLFCPRCGQSRVSPLPPPEPEGGPEPDSEKAVVTSDPEGEPAVSQTKDTLSRAADWLKRLGRRDHTDELSAPRATSRPFTPIPTSEVVLPVFTPGVGGEGNDAGDSPTDTPPRGRDQARFVLRTEDSRHFTVGELPGGLGAAVSQVSPDGSEWVWISLRADDQSIEEFHLRFGVDDGVFWVADQNSEYGTVVSEPGRAALQCIPYERYFLVRGSVIRVGSLSLTLH